MEKHTCKLCSRRFPNGRALGGHMRSHVPSSSTQQPPPIKRQLLLLPSSASSASSASTSSAELPTVIAVAPVAAAAAVEDVKGTSGASYRLRENPRKSSRLVDPVFSFHAAPDGEPSGSVVQDRESETESPAASGHHRRRSKRPRRTTFGPPPSPPESAGPASSASCTTTEEDLAICLMMLSRGSWTTKSEPKEVDDEEDDVDGGVSGGVSGGRLRPEKRRNRHQCGTCKKVFRSYQALGGHRASHKKTGGGCVPFLGDDHEDDAGDKVHECPFCFRVFTSGQALGGHKRSHLMSSAGATININSQVSIPAQPHLPPSTSPATATSGAKCDNGAVLFDLNLPAPVDDDMEFSAVFDPVLAVE